MIDYPRELAALTAAALTTQTEEAFHELAAARDAMIDCGIATRDQIDPIVQRVTRHAGYLVGNLFSDPNVWSPIGDPVYAGSQSHYRRVT